MQSLLNPLNLCKSKIASAGCVVRLGSLEKAIRVVLVIPGGAQTTEGRIKQIIEMEATTLCSTPTYALHLWQKAREMGIDLAKDSKVNKLILSGEPAGSIPAAKRQLEEAWGAKAGDTAGMTEVGTIMIFECSHQPGDFVIINLTRQAQRRVLRLTALVNLCRSAF